MWVAVLEESLMLFMLIIILLLWDCRIQDVKDAIDELSELADDDSDETAHIVVRALKKSIYKF